MTNRILKNKDMKMFKFKSLKSLVAVAVLALSFIIAQTTFAQEQISKNVVLIHGAFADGSGYKSVYEILTNKGITYVSFSFL